MGLYNVEKRGRSIKPFYIVRNNKNNIKSDFIPFLAQNLVRKRHITYNPCSVVATYEFLNDLARIYKVQQAYKVLFYFQT